MSEIIETLPTQIAGIDNEKQVIILVIGAHRVNANGETVKLTASQASAALANAKASLEIVDGTEVVGTSTALILPDVELQDGESLTLKIDTQVIKSEGVV